MFHPAPRFRRGDYLRFFLLFVFLVAWGVVARGADRKKAAVTQDQPSDTDVGAPTFPSLQAEMDAHHLADDLLQARVRLADLDAKRADSVAATRLLVRGDREGLALLKRYERLITVRYTNEDGDFDKAAEISGDDVTNLNQLFDHYLHRMPFAAQWGKISASFAHETLEQGIDQLGDLASAHDDPSPKNNAELQILALQMQNEKDAIDHVLDVADAHGIKLDPKAPLPENARIPAASE